MLKFVVVFAVCLAVAAAGIGHPAALAVGPAPFAYTNAPLYAPGGSQQIDVRHNYDGTLSSYTTTPFGYTSPISSRYVAGAPAVAGPVSAYPAPAAYATPVAYPAPAAYAAPGAFAVPAGYATPAAYAAPFAAPAPYASFAPLAAAPAKIVL